MRRSVFAPLRYKSIFPDLVDKKLSQYPLPILRLARLAVSEKTQGQGLGGSLLRFSFDLALKLSAEYGCIGILVDAKKEAEKFYQQYGFYHVHVMQGRSGTRPLPTSMFLPIGTIRQALGKKK